MEKNNSFVVYNATYAGALKMMGYKLIKAVPNYTNPKYFVYIFEREEGIYDALMKISNKSK